MSSGRGKKRKSTGFVESPHKRRKLQHFVPHSKLFAAESQEDEQYQSIAQSVHESELGIDLQIPACIAQDIAEFATGIVHCCDNKECDVKVVILSSDKAWRPDFGHYWLDTVDMKYYCTFCAQQWALECPEEGRRRWIGKDNINECADIYCHRQIVFHDCSGDLSISGFSRYSCAGCDKVICEECVLWPDCCHTSNGESYCWDCATRCSFGDPECGRAICLDCSWWCEGSKPEDGCAHPLCEDHASWCTACKNYFCGDHLLQCELCDKCNDDDWGHGLCCVCN